VTPRTYAPIRRSPNKPFENRTCSKKEGGGRIYPSLGLRGKEGKKGRSSHLAENRSPFLIASTRGGRKGRPPARRKKAGRGRGAFVGRGGKKEV